MSYRTKAWHSNAPVDLELQEAILHSLNDETVLNESDGKISDALPKDDVVTTESPNITMERLAPKRWKEKKMLLVQAVGRFLRRKNMK